MTFHHLRHGAATLMLASGVDLATIRDVLGHSSYALTASTYAHVIEKAKQDAADRLDAVLTAS